jgi:hypothetical protein
MAWMNGEERRLALRKAAVDVGKLVGYRAATRHIIAEHAKVSSSLVPVYLGDVDTMRRNILHDGCKDGEIKLIIEGVLEGDRVAKKAALKFKDKILQLLFK